MKIKFLIDENTWKKALGPAIKQLDSSIDVIHVGDPGAPVLGTFDPEILIYCEREQRLLLTQNRKSMHKHVIDHLAQGHLFWGIGEIREGFSIGDVARFAHLIWSASEAEEWQGLYEFIPWGKR